MNTCSLCGRRNSCTRLELYLELDKANGSFRRAVRSFYDYSCALSHTSSFAHSPFVNPFILSLSGATGPGGPEFAEWAKKTEADHGVVFLSSMKDLPAIPEGTKRLALVSGRTGDNPRFLGECIAVSRVIYLDACVSSLVVCSLDVMHWISFSLSFTHPS